MHDDDLLPVVLAPIVPVPGNAVSDTDGMIVIEVGQVRVRIEGLSDASVLAQVSDRVLW